MRFVQLGFVLAVLAGLLLCSVGYVFAQSVPGNIKGQIKDAGDEGAIGARVVLKRSGETIAGTNTDDEGNYIIRNIDPGTYVLEVSYGSQKASKTVNISAGQTTKEDLSISAKEIEAVVIQEQLIRADYTVRETKYDLKQLQDFGSRDIGSAVSLGSGVYQADEGRAIQVRGGRSDQTQTFVDGMRVIGNATVPQLSIKSISLISGGTPPWYGDVTSGVVEIESADPSPKHYFGGELLTSQFLDPQRFNLAALTASGPILKGRLNPSDTTSELTTKLGYFLAVELNHQRDASPPGIDLYRLRPDKLEEIRNQPLVPLVTGGQLSFVSATNFLRRNDFETTNYRDNNDRLQVSVNGRLDYKLNQNTSIKFGGNYRLFRGDFWNIRNQPFAPENNQFQTTTNARAFVRFSQGFIPKDADNSVIKSIFYNLQVDYTYLGAETYNRDFRRSFFKYGHVGQFAINHDGSSELLPYRQVDAFQPIFPGTANHDPRYTSAAYWQTAGYADTSLTFNAANSSNPALARYNQVILDYLRSNPRAFNNPFFLASFGELRSGIFGFNDFIQLGGLMNGLSLTPNGFGPANPYSLFTMPGQVFSGYNKSRSDMFRMTGYATIELGGKKSKSDEGGETKKPKGTHTLRVGFEFDQRVQRFFSVGAPGLWTLARQLTNRHLQNPDTSVNGRVPIYVDGPSGERFFQDTVRLNRRYIAGDQTNFDRNLRRKLGLAENSIEFINTDFYGPDMYSLDMFSANELFRNGRPIVNYYGFDYKGNRVGDAARSDFFSDLDNRPMNAYRPTYIAGYVQDKFELENVFFTLGFRVDRLDLNQPVLRDPYVMRPFYTAREAASRGNFSLPSNIGGNWVPYVDRLIDNENAAPLGPENILGYRDNKTWYDRNGTPVDPELLRVNGEVIPYIRQDSLTIDAFKDYEPQINFMPRVSFSFSVTDQANFFAHYDVLTQRPTGAEIGQFVDYLFIEQNATSEIANPALRPQRTVDYEVGFQQALDRDQTASLVISAFYREMRDMIQFFRYQNAYPITYDSYENLDFGTVKGFTFEFRTNSARLLSIRANYTLQYAEGTGSGFNTARNAVQGIPGFSVIRNLLPFSFDQRHTITSNVTMRFDDRMNRKGPKIGNIYPLRNSSASLTFRGGSGTPYTRNALPNRADVQFGVNATTQTLGTPNGSRLPFNFNFDLRLDKSFEFVLGGTKALDGEGKPMKTGGRPLSLQTYIVILNVFNIQNTLGIYAFSGQATTSGFLQSQQGRQLISQQINPEAFVDQFVIREQNPDFFNLPRRIRLGMLFNF
jgi:hypothetical protein